MKIKTQRPILTERYRKFYAVMADLDRLGFQQGKWQSGKRK